MHKACKCNQWPITNLVLLHFFRFWCLKSLLPPKLQSIFKRGSWFLLTEYETPAPDVTLTVMALSALTMCRKQYHHSPYSLLKISFCFHLFANTELSTCNSISVTTALERFLFISFLGSQTIQVELTFLLSLNKLLSFFCYLFVVIVLCYSAVYLFC